MMDAQKTVKPKRQKKKKSRTEGTEIINPPGRANYLITHSLLIGLRKRGRKDPKEIAEIPNFPRDSNREGTFQTFDLNRFHVLTIQQEIAEPKAMTDSDVRSAFTKYYMQRAATEFAEDLDKIRGADDFRDDTLPLLIGALQQGTEVFSIEEQRRIVLAGREKKE